MRVLVACEYSGRVREAFRRRGHDAWSCDLLPAEPVWQYEVMSAGGEWVRETKLREPPDRELFVIRNLTEAEPQHFDCDIRDVPVGWGNRWDLLIAHPPCTHLSVSGARHFEQKRADGRQQEAIDFFLWLTEFPAPRIAIENPVCIMSSVWREPDQIIQPWQFGHGETKATCLWLKGLPPLVPTNVVPGREPRVHRMSPSPDRWKERSRTYEGIAEAMAEQWGSAPLDLVTQAEAA